LLLLFLLAIAEPLWHGYRFGVSNHSIQLSIIHRIMDGSLFPNDPMLDTAAGYVSFFPSLMAFAVGIVGNTEGLYFALQVLSFFLYFAALYLLIELIFDKVSATIGVILMATSKVVLGGSSIHWAIFYPSFFIMPFILLAIYFFLKERYLIAYAVVGISMNFHTLISSYTFCMFACYSLLSFLPANRNGPGFNLQRLALQWARGLGVFFLCASPAIIWALSTGGELTDEWIRLLRVRSSHHSFPLSWDASHYVNYLLFLAAGALSFSYLPADKIHRKLLAFALAIGILCTAGLVFTEFYPLRLALRGQFFRSTNFLTIFCVIYVSNYIRHSWKSSALHKAVAAVIFFSLFFRENINLLIPGLVFALVADRFLNRTRPSPWVVIFVAIAIGVKLLWPHSGSPAIFDLDPIAGIFRVLANNGLLQLIVCAAITLILISKFYNGHQKWVQLAVTALLVVYIIPSSYGRLHPENRTRAPWRDVQVWARENTKKSDLFLTPPDLTGFRIFSKRPIVGEWKDGTQQYFDEHYTYEWWKRMQDMGIETGGPKAFNKLGKAAYLELAHKYGAGYLVLRSKRALALPKAYDNGQFAVYRLD
jgi:hypothetical protein